MRSKFFPALFVGAFLAAETPKSGIDVNGIDLTCKPCADFWRYANGTFLDKNPIPARYPLWGTMSIVREGNKERMRTILEAAALAKSVAGSDQRRLGDLYGSCMNTAAIDARGL